jgi:glycosyltransferase involved in cell wall biosynthesis
MNKTLKISAIVVGFNEGKLLQNCISSISFCDEILYFDLGSSDDSIKIAETLNAKVINHERVPGCEWIHSKFYKTTKHDWVLIIDPDEVVNQNLAREITLFFLNNKIDDIIGSIEAPEIYYFKEQKLKGTPWGGFDKHRVLIVNKNRFDFLPIVHMGRKIKSGFTTYKIKFNGNNYISHYWMSSYSQLIEKHKRYLVNEGLARYNTGNRVNILTIIKAPLKQFIISFFIMRGYKDYFIGFFLSLFWSWYQTSALIKLYRVQISKIHA